jgi:hypothetical protein
MNSYSTRALNVLRSILADENVSDADRIEAFALLIDRATVTDADLDVLAKIAESDLSVTRDQLAAASLLRDAF